MTDNGGLPEPTFEILVTQLAAQALMQLGEVPSPLTGLPEVALDRAKFTLALMEVIEAKTRGNLQPQQDRFLQETLARVRAKYQARL
ncbi:MAG: DUF1844 domain-containing protein [Planctomycetes bacterium]|nr:DUF1844 domain-containing protein [Planctomycetota bacterium]